MKIPIAINVANIENTENKKKKIIAKLMHGSCTIPVYYVNKFNFYYLYLGSVCNPLGTMVYIAYLLLKLLFM